jgi:small basic protein (TIGR04137 family)
VRVTLEHCETFPYIDWSPKKPSFSGRSFRMTIDKSLRVKRGATRNRSVLTRVERIARLREADRWTEGDSPLGLPKVRVRKLAMKKKKKKKEEEGAEGAEGAAAAPGTAAPAAAAPAAKAPAGKAPAGKPGGGKK